MKWNSQRAACVARARQHTAECWAENRYNLSVSKRQWSYVLVFVLMALIVFGPLYETFDHWDKFTQGGDDTVLTLIGLLTYTGFVLCICPFVLGTC